MSHVKGRMLCVLLFVTFAAGCRNQSPSTMGNEESDQEAQADATEIEAVGRSTGSAQQTADSVIHKISYWDFRRYRPGERSGIEAGLRRLKEEPFAPDLNAINGLYRFPVDPTALRYLLLAYLHGYDGPDGRQWGVSLYAIEQAVSDWAASAPYDLKQEPFPSYVSVAAIEDFDEDGLADVALCRWPEGAYDETGPEVQPTIQILGHRESAWYEVDRTGKELPDCT